MSGNSPTGFRICERCAAKYKLDEAFFFRKNSKGVVNKIYSALSYKYCAECLPYFEKDAEKVKGDE